MCQWYTQQYDELMQQIDRFNIKLITRNGDWSVDDVPEHAAAVAANIDQSVDFLAPRAGAHPAEGLRRRQLLPAVPG